MNTVCYPVFRQAGKEARLELLAGFTDFGSLQMFKDGSGAIHDSLGRELLRFHDVNHLKAIAESGKQRIAEYGQGGEDLLGYTYTTFANRKKRVKRVYASVSQNGAVVELRLLSYYPGFSTITLFADGSGAVNNFDDQVVGRFHGIEDLHRLLVSHAVKRRLQGEPRK